MKGFITNKIHKEQSSLAVNGATIRSVFQNSRSSLVHDKRKPSPFFKPQVQPKLTINLPNDVYEQEADAVAEKVMRMDSNDTVQGKFFSPFITTIQRKCSHCEEEERKMQRKELNEEETTIDHDLKKYVDNLDSKGKSLPEEVRNFYEPRIGYDFSKVKIHTDSVAAKSAQSINAIAYTSGNNIVFNSGQYSPDSSSGKKLLAHELTHVVQQSSNIQPTSIQRMTISTADAFAPLPRSEAWRGFHLRTVPESEVPTIRAAVAIIQNIVDNPGTYGNCMRGYTEHCPGHSPTAFVDVFNRAILWRIDDSTYRARGDTNGRHIGYSQLGYEEGAQGLARVLMHEMGHNCGITGEGDHYLATVVETYCMGLDSDDDVSPRLRIALNSPAVGLALAYRRWFDLALGGQLQLSVGADFDVIGLAMGIIDAASPLTPSFLSEFELGSLSVGLRQRINLWGGEGFGGITLGQEVGFDVGRFRIIRETGTEFEYGPGFIAQTNLGAEFYIPVNPYIMTLSIEAGYRFIRPLNPAAESLYELVFGFRVGLQ